MLDNMFDLALNVSFLQLVVVGDQSPGKSSLLETLTKIPFPRPRSTAKIVVCWSEVELGDDDLYRIRMEALLSLPLHSHPSLTYDMSQVTPAVGPSASGFLLIVRCDASYVSHARTQYQKDKIYKSGGCTDRRPDNERACSIPSTR